MSVKAVIDLSEDLYQTLSSHGLSKEAISKETRKLLALKCYKEKILSLGKSTELSGLSMWEFIEFLSENNGFIRKKVEKDISNNSVSFRLVRNLSLLFCPQMPVFRRIPDALRLRE